MGHGEGTCPNSYVMCDVVKGHTYTSVTRGLVQLFSIPLAHHLNVYLLPVPFLSLHGFWFRNYFTLLLENSHFPPFVMTGIQILQPYWNVQSSWVALYLSNFFCCSGLLMNPFSLSRPNTDLFVLLYFSYIFNGIKKQKCVFSSTSEIILVFQMYSYFKKT